MVWQEKFGADFDLAEANSLDIASMFANSDEADPAVSGNYCQLTSYNSFW